MSLPSASREARVPRIVSLLNPIVRRLMEAGMPVGPNVLLTVPGRRTGVPHTFPVALLRVHGRLVVQSPFGEVDWVRNLRAARSATLSTGAQERTFDAIELTPDDGGRILREALRPFHRHRLGARFARIFVPLPDDASDEDYARHVRSHPMFELRSLRSERR